MILLATDMKKIPVAAGPDYSTEPYLHPVKSQQLKHISTVAAS